jgi:CMP/dCMP kinase
MTSASPIITIDGPSGAGKSTVARGAAQELGLRYLDTGAMYRAVTLHCMRVGARLEVAKAIADALESLHLRVELVLDGPMQVFLGDEDVTGKIRTIEVTRNIHYVADVLEVRSRLVSMQRDIGRQGRLVTEGRDQGSVVFPDAALKIYMFATPEVRARRRFEELQSTGADVTYAEVLEDVARRDHLDQSREVGALRKAPDAIELDTSDMTPRQVVAAIVDLARDRLSL